MTTLPPIPPDREDGSSSWVHRAMILSGQLGLIKPEALTPGWIALVAIAGWPWNALRLYAGGIAGAALLADWMMLSLLPRARRSWGPTTPPLLALTLVRSLVGWALAGLWPTLGGLVSWGVFQAVVSAVAIYSTWIEPFHLSITRQTLTLPQWGAAPPLRLLHISDLHFEGHSPRETALLEQVRILCPDVIVLTGDYLNLSSVYDAEAQRGARAILEQLAAPLGVYAITGSPVVDAPHLVPGIFQGLPIHWLNDAAATLEHAGQTVYLMGVRCTYREDRDLAAARALLYRAPEGALNVLLYHTPDLTPMLATPAPASSEVHLYLAGHTHGGQIRAPFYGAIATSSRWGKRYEMGRYREGNTTLYVSRGLGMEGLGAPRARFLSPPEVVVWTLQGPAEK